jgi:CBS domain-containing protein
MGEQKIPEGMDQQQLRAFMRALLEDVQALEYMLENDLIESGIRRIGAEQEMFLVDRACRPAPRAMEVLEQIDDPHFTTELARFNLEANLDPLTFGGDCLRRMEAGLKDLLTRASIGARAYGTRVVLTGILPTLRRADLTLENMTPNPRYLALNREMLRLRGGSFPVQISGLDELETTHDNILLEACNTSFQVHFQVGHREFARLYNLSQAVMGPVLACAANSPLLLGQRLWQETRVALFQQSVDVRSEAHQERGYPQRVSFGDRWVRRSVLEIFREDIARFRVVLATGLEENPLALLSMGKTPPLSALRLHNGTVYRWNRACYGAIDGKAHLRIENRALPAGPTVIDEVANAALYFGLMAHYADRPGDIADVMSFDVAKSNFLLAAQHGLQAQQTWLDGHILPARELILKELLPAARAGLKGHGIEQEDIDRYLGVIADRVESGRNGATWLLNAYASLATSGTKDQNLRALVDATSSRQERGDPVHTWERVELGELGDWRESYQTIGQFMTTAVFTVRPQDLIDLAASLMEWEHIKHVPVEDDDGNLVGLVSARAFLRLVARGLSMGRAEDNVPVEQIMKTNLITVTPDTPTIDAIALMRIHRIGCLPVVNGHRLVGIVTERDFLNVAGKLMEQQLRDD